MGQEKSNQIPINAYVLHSTKEAAQITMALSMMKRLIQTLPTQAIKLKVHKEILEDR